MAYYESVFIARQEMSGSQVEGLADQYAQLVQELGGSVVKREHWGLRNLAFRMAKNRKGHYVMFNIDGPAAAIDEMQRQMRLSEDVLRYMTIRVDEIDPNPSAMLTSKGSRDDRPRRGDRDEERGRRGDRDRDREERGRDERGRDERPRDEAAAAEGTER